MHIGINAQLLSYGQSYRNGGVSRYIRYLLTQIARQPGNHTYTIFVNGQDVIEQLEHHPQITFLAAPWPESRPAARIAWEQLTLPRLVRQHQIDVLHSPVNVRPELLPARCASVVTLHDLAFLRFPHVLTPAKRLYHQTFTLRSLKRATLLITVSESTKRDVHELVGISYERIQAIYPCIDERFSNVSIEDKLDTFREKYGVAEGFILYLGTLEPRKNITTLLDAYAQLRQQHHIREKLVLAGGKGWLYDTIFARVRQLGLEQDVLFPGFVPDDEQALWYKSASVFAYPSLYEGFGIPVAEALACGTPVVTSNVSSLPEAGAGLALCVDPQDVTALSAALYQALTDQTLRERCQCQATMVAQQFSARTMAKKTIAAYELAAKIHHSQRITFVQ
ncbi:glycosyltransferase family 4 protein [Dictyobacter aurantiacus]|uniref:Glycosyl transferase family 1 n=1 Tax=Dictyobacter aurantiacus TaxID=1936993 RepID=A0A401ZA93_9CHLR|nr:glycosyltransferase family 1 protein [Dictyobacter aurantiacus]GCE03785.1 glycosyl transferase family 1 [Dictyobacter aurantiacus]